MTVSEIILICWFAAKKKIILPMLKTVVLLNIFMDTMNKDFFKEQKV